MAFSIRMRTFRLGGIHPQAKKITADKKISIAELPQRVAIQLSNHIGAPSEAVVNEGDIVKVGQLIGRSKGFVSANVHSSVSGRVSKIATLADISGNPQQAIFIDVIGDDWLETIDRTNTLFPDCSLNKEDILSKIQDAGIVGLGGATFPTHVKLSPPPKKKAEYLIINAVECEPYLTCDHQLMLEKAEEILVGTTILMKTIEVSKAIIGIENNKKDAIRLLSKLAISYSGVTIQPLTVKYPQGGEKQLIDSIIQRQVPSGQIPIEVGVVVQNVATAFAVYEAVQKNKPLFERLITVTGEAAVKPGNYLIRLGVYISDIINQTGGISQNTGKIIIGGPMMGRALVNIDAPTTKGSAGILLLNKEDVIQKPVKNCIRCSRCVSACPMGLEPFLLMKFGEREMWEEMENNMTMDCIECGCCNYSCPSNRPMLDYIRVGKTTVGGIIRNRKN